MTRKTVIVCDLCEAVLSLGTAHVTIFEQRSEADKHICPDCKEKLMSIWTRQLG